MSSITCPRCGSPVVLRRFFNLANKPFCTRCGWNMDRAEAALASKGTALKLIPIAIAGLGFFAFFAATRAHSPFTYIFPAIVLLVGLAPLWSYYSNQKAIAAAKFTVNPGLAQAQPPLDPSLQMLQSLPRPRRVRFRFGGSLFLGSIVVVAFLTGLIYAFTLLRVNARHLPTNRNDFAVLLPFLFMLVIFVIIAVVPLVREKRNLPLLRDGELVFARITAQQTVQQGKSSYSRIDYEFKTNTGQLVQNSVKDLTNSVFEDMTVPVFYDPADPSKNIPSCATYLAIAGFPY